LSNKRKEDILNGNIKNILIVRQHNQLGDMLCSVPLFSALRKKFPEARVTLVASKMNYEIIFSDINPYIDDVEVFDKSTVPNITKLIKRLRKKDFDLGIVPSTVSISRTSHWINYFSGAKLKVGVNSINSKVNKVAYLLDIKSDFEWDERKVHQTERNLDIGRQIGCDLNEDEKKNVRITLSDGEKNQAEEFLQKHFSDKQKPIFGFHPGAGKNQNRWAGENFEELIIQLYKKYNPYILITSGLIDTEITESITRNLDSKGIEYTILGTPIRKVASVLTKSHLYVTNDTGTLHVAAFVNANVIGLFGPTNGYEWGPLNQFGSYIQSKTNNIKEITVKEVFDKSCIRFEDYINKKGIKIRT